MKRCGFGALIAAAYELTHDFDAAYKLGHTALRPHCGTATLVHVNDSSGYAAVLALLNAVIAAEYTYLDPRPHGGHNKRNVSSRAPARAAAIAAPNRRR